MPKFKTCNHHPPSSKLVLYDIHCHCITEVLLLVSGLWKPFYLERIHWKNKGSSYLSILYTVSSTLIILVFSTLILVPKTQLIKTFPVMQNTAIQNIS